MGKICNIVSENMFYNMFLDFFSNYACIIQGNFRNFAPKLINLAEKTN